MARVDSGSLSEYLELGKDNPGSPRHRDSLPGVCAPDPSGMNSASGSGTPSGLNDLGAAVQAMVACDGHTLIHPAENLAALLAPRKEAPSQIDQPANPQREFNCDREIELRNLRTTRLQSQFGRRLNAPNNEAI